MKIIVGLGNPGSKYAPTRHNIGFMVLDKWAHLHGIDIHKAQFQSLVGELRLGTEKIILVKPMTFMNLSGVAVREVMDFYKLPLEDLMVVVDDVEIELGMLRIRKNANKGTHNGLRSIFQHLHTDDYPKMKLGVGKFMRDRDLADFVLSRPSKEEDPIIDDLIDRAIAALEVYCTEGIDLAMNKYNGKPE
ncbi:MAG: aminoacyl-tRNA hydrolase [Tissierellia bacterium]|nr:aminoacyl-tRNA hydrolase [Tissierellia bacterium]